MFTVYVLRSDATGRLYVGLTRDVERRVFQHNDGVTKSTKGRGPWRLVYREECETRSTAVRRERFLKSGQGRELLKGLLSEAERSPAG
ncbi:MAG TPA: GIY-YIG nuclease family protein [Candidatus Dormibacteraeota bacterium]|nr:GIY-YIG nuclease family protein [Candidatus Dormibacteraeota bacterium]